MQQSAAPPSPLLAPEVRKVAALRDSRAPKDRRGRHKYLPAVCRARARKLRKRTESSKSSSRARPLRLGSANRRRHPDGSEPCVSPGQPTHFRRAVLRGRRSGWSTHATLLHGPGRDEASLGPSVRISPLCQRGLKGQGSPTLRSRRPDLSWAPRGKFTATLETSISGRGGIGLLCMQSTGDLRQEDAR